MQRRFFDATRCYPVLLGGNVGNRVGCLLGMHMLAVPAGRSRCVARALFLRRLLVLPEQTPLAATAQEWILLDSQVDAGYH